MTKSMDWQKERSKKRTHQQGTEEVDDERNPLQKQIRNQAKVDPELRHFLKKERRVAERVMEKREKKEKSNQLYHEKKAAKRRQRVKMRVKAEKERLASIEVAQQKFVPEVVLIRNGRIVD